MKFSSEEAIRYAKENRLEEWAHLFLTNSVNNPNPGLSEGLKKQKRYWYGPEQISLDKLSRICGPEENMDYKEDEQVWERRVGDLVNEIKKGWNPPPLIVEYQGGSLVVRDGNHRLEALRRSGLEKFWTIVWFNNEKDFDNFKR